MTDAPVRFAIAPAGDVIALDMWDGSTPTDAALRVLRAEACRWWLIDAGDRAAALAERIGDAGAMSPIGGGLLRATLTGAGWRWLLSVSGCLDTERPDFGRDRLLGSVLHHVPVWIAVIGEEACEVYLPASYGATLVDLWTRAIGAP